MGTLQENFVALAREAEPGITMTALARRCGISRSLIHRGTFSVEAAVEKWNAGSEQTITLIPARLELGQPKGATTD